MKPRFCKIEEALDALSSGLVVIVVDSEDRENEGDFVAAADRVSPEMIHFLISHGRGQVCMPITAATAQRLEFIPMATGTDKEMPNFTVPVDYARCKTGISPVERCATIQAIMDEETSPADFHRPGHMFPLIAREGGVLVRQGHTEASVDLVRMAGLRPGAVLCEICSGDGRNMANRDELMSIAEDCRIPIMTIDALIEHRLKEERSTRASAGLALC
jgi:3,4-dihydroxy 2-butanone 4-phosphate synthase/GTP cyclohydrolase II